MIYAPTNSAQSVFVLRKWQIWLSDSWYYIEGHENLDIIWKDMRTLILYWRTWKPWYYIEGHENQLNSIENAILPENNRERLSSMLFKRRIVFYSFKLSFLHCSLFLFKIFSRNIPTRKDNFAFLKIYFFVRMNHLFFYCVLSLLNKIKHFSSNFLFQERN